MKSEDLLKYDVGDSSTPQQDPFSQYISGIPDDEVYILLTGLEWVQDLDDPWALGLDGILPMVQAAINEFDRRELATNGYLEELIERGKRAIQ